MPDEQHLFFGYSPPGHSCKSPITGISACPVAGVQCQGHELEEIEAAIEKALPPRDRGIAVRLLWNPPMTYVRKEGQWAKVPLALPQGLGVDVRNGARGFIAGNREALAFGLRALVGEG
ncbi:MAG TPA: hypothetical protein VNI83_02120 [Vicinamibacterales bacterium]|nr:hypothetical protein [Vicinamibacterales bacterium]